MGIFVLFVLLIAHHMYWVRCLIVDEIVSHIVFFYVLIKTMWRILFEIFLKVLFVMYPMFPYLLYCSFIVLCINKDNDSCSVFN